MYIYNQKHNNYDNNYNARNSKGIVKTEKRIQMIHWVIFTYILLTGINGPNTITATEIRNDAQVYITNTHITYIFE